MRKRQPIEADVSCSSSKKQRYDIYDYVSDSEQSDTEDRKDRSKTSSSIQSHHHSIHHIIQAATIITAAAAAATQQFSQGYQCEQCGKIIASKQSLKQHVKAVHDKIKDFQCTECEKLFSSKPGLKLHMGTVHKKIRDFECEKRRLAKSSSKKLERIISKKPQLAARKKHRGKGVMCKECNKILASNAILRRHVRSIHEKIRDFHCKQCDRSYSQKVTLDRHVQSIHSKNQQVQKQTMRTKAPALRGKQCGDKPRNSSRKEDQPICTECRLTFPSSASLHEHILDVHDNEIQDLDSDCAST